MIKLFFLLYFLFNVQTATAGSAGKASDDDFFRITEEMLLAESGKNEIFQQDLKNRLSLLDINGDELVSDTEIKEMIKGLDILSNLTEKEKKEMAAAAKKAFNESDSDHNRLLNNTEMETFEKKFGDSMIRLAFKKKDANGDGVIDFKDMPSVEDSMKELDEAVKKLEALSKKMESKTPEEMANNFLKNTGAAIAKEDFYRMDENGNGCVSAAEYVKYQLNRQQKMSTEEDSPYQISREDFQSLYKETKKRKPDCLTMDEYIAQQSSFLDWNAGDIPE